jgi:hypothetical protein
MRRVLIYAEPFPIRNRFDEFADAALLLARAMTNSEGFPDEVRVFGNDAVVDSLCRRDALVGSACLRPTDDERAEITRQFRHWGDDSIRDWLDLAAGRGPVSAFYEHVVERLHERFPFDVVLLWGENGAVRRAAKKLGAVVVHGELGPTRPPFQPTLYFDPAGVNGNASALAAPIEVADGDAFDTEIWLARGAEPGGTAPLDARVILDVGLQEMLPNRPFVFAPLQLADDLNTLAHSDFASPEDFLRQLAPPVLEAGFDLVVKPHPGAVHRPYNLVREDAALAYARRLGPAVSVLPRDLPPLANPLLMSHAAAVCSINSSVAFEAGVMGAPSFVFGRAVFDPFGEFRLRLEDLPDRLRTLSDWPGVDRSVAFGLRHYFLPRNAVMGGQALPAVVKFLSGARRGKPSSAAYWSRWKRLVAGLETRPEIPFEPGVIIAGAKLPLGRDPLPVQIEEDTVSFERRDMDRLVVKRLYGRFTCFLDFIDLGGPQGRVAGWAALEQGDQPPTAILVASPSHVLAGGVASVERTDVSELLPHAATDLFGFDLMFEVGPATDQPLRFLLVDEDGAVEVVDIVRPPASPR